MKNSTSEPILVKEAWDKTTSEEQVATQEKSSKGWGSLLVDFTQDTTLHGLRQVTGNAVYTARRLVQKLGLTPGEACAAMPSQQLKRRKGKKKQKPCILNPGKVCCRLQKRHLQFPKISEGHALNPLDSIAWQIG